MRMTLPEIAEVTGGVLSGDASTVVDDFDIDSRTIEPGGLFVAVAGERDGHDFLSDAFEAGAAAALVSRAPEPPPEAWAGVLVDDTVSALRRLGEFARSRVTGTVVAITGSTGKTSTKDLCASALGTWGRVAASPASFNNELGVPLTVLRAPDGVDALVAEVGARGQGQIAETAAWLRPRIGVVTTVGAAHTELFGSVEGVARAKAELLEALPPDGTGVVGTGHEYSDLLVQSTRARVLTVGREGDEDVTVEHLRLDEALRPSFDLATPWGRFSVHLEARGSHQAHNAALAATVALVVGASLEQVGDGLARARPSRWRMEIDETAAGVVVINDAYNANPASAAAALAALSQVSAPGRRWAVLGEMAELGDRSADEHRRLGSLAAERGVDRLIAVGPATRPLADAARAAGGVVDEVADAEGAATLLVSEVNPGDVVLLKASRVVGLEQVADALSRIAGGGANG